MATTLTVTVLGRQVFLAKKQSLASTIMSLRAAYAKPAGATKLPKGMAAMPQRQYLEVETDPEKLCKFVCGANIYKEGSDPEIKSDSEYPDWLWTLRTDRRPPHLEELDQDTWAYWRQIRKAQWRDAKQKLKNRYKYKRFS